MTKSENNSGSRDVPVKELASLVWATMSYCANGLLKKPTSFTSAEVAAKVVI